MKAAYVYAIPGNTYALCRGRLGGWFRSHGIPAYRSNVHNGWWVRAERVDDVVALMQDDGLLVRFSTTRWPLWVPPPLDQPDEQGDDYAMRRSA
ncbi:MAG: hypothetical protein M3Y26_09345 [Actinomycetota bacterium]|nr:hypothetical protein [Actinomycetota bacterium]